MQRISLLALAALLSGVQAHAQLVISTALTPAELVQNILVGGGVTISNVSFNGVASPATSQVGTGSFVATSSNLGLTAGLILSSGDVASIAAPADNFITETNGSLSDPDLVAITTPGNEINDAAVLEFDFIPTGDSLKFNYVFGSEEYSGYSCNPTYNDVFGFFLSGPGVSGPYTNNAANIALVPNTTLPVSIATIHGDYDAGCTPMNGEYFVNNLVGTTVAFDGFTTVLQARAHVQCGQLYHIKLAVGDAGDSGYDSGVFLQAGSFASNTLPALGAATVTGDGIVEEGCEGSVFVVNRPAGVDTTITISYFLSGTATPGSDYASLPNPIIIPEGEASVSYDLHPVADNIVEGNESVILTVYAVNACGDSISASTTITIADYVPVQIVTETPVQLHCDQDSVLLTASVVGGYGQVTYYWDQGLASSERWIPGHEDGEYTVTAFDQCVTQSTRTVFVDSGCEIIIPNVLTPNGDGDNEVFVIKGILGKENQVKLYDRWGKEVYSTRNYRNSFKASDLHDGVYFYTVEVEDKLFTGNLTVLGSR